MDYTTRKVTIVAANIANIDRVKKIDSTEEKKVFHVTVNKRTRTSGSTCAIGV